ncbi:MAG: hypothetical protein IPM14_16385 [bacterium]|nr:hypothetical protein [bacterium]
MKKSSLFLLFIICFTFTGYAQLDSVFYQGPATGSVASGVMISLNQFTFEAPSEGENRIADRNTEVTYNESVIIDVDPSTLPEFVYVEDTNVHGYNDGTNGETVILNRWPGMNMENSIPPDPIVAAGPDHVIACVNSRFLVWDKQGNLLANINADTWIAPVINAGAFDPQIIYDHYAGRWFMLWDWWDEISQAYFIISYSDDADPFGTWYMYRLDSRQNGTATTSTWGDFPQIGFDEEAIYIDSRQFGFAGGLQYNKIRILNKSELYSSNGGLLTWKDIWDIRRPNQTSEKPDVLEPAISYTPGQGGYFFWTWSSPVPGGGSNVYYLYKILSPISTTPRLRGKVISTQFYYNSPDANQLGGGTALDAGSSKLRHSPIVRDGYLYMAHPVGNTTNTSYSAIRYAKIDLSVPSVTEHSEFGLIGYYYLYPALTVDKNHNIAVTFSRSGDSEYCGAFISTKHASDPAGLNPSVPIQVGLGNYVVTFGGSRNRWGDYMGIYLDPVNELNVWTFTEYARTGNTWGTYVGQIRMESYPGAHAFANSFTVDFGNLEVGSAPITKSVTVSNYGEDDLVINTINSPTGPFTLLTNLTLPIHLHHMLV